VSREELDWVQRRGVKTSSALRAWLANVGRAGGEQFQLATAPTLGLTVSGGGLRSMLVGAGVVQALDGDDSKTGVSGLYQAMSYQAGLSGGAWLLSSQVGNDFDKISGVQKDPWATSLLEKNTLILTENVKTQPERATAIANDIAAKAKAGFRPTPADAWGRASGYVTLRARDGGAHQRLSDARNATRFRDHDVPYPIITALGLEDINGKLCDAVPTEGDYDTQYEFTPHEFGSWQKGVEGFIPTDLLGTTGADGKAKDDVCVRNFDNLGFVMGISSMRFNEDCGHAGSAALLLPALNDLMEPEFKVDMNKPEAVRRQLYAPIPNPFKALAASPKVNKYDELFLFDGGQCRFLPDLKI
jgi:lysophospholipase